MKHNKSVSASKSFIYVLYIFRDTSFLIDKERKWEKKTIKQVEEYGYVNAGFYPTNEATYIIFVMEDL